MLTRTRRWPYRDCHLVSGKGLPSTSRALAWSSSPSLMLHIRCGRRQACLRWRQVTFSLTWVTAAVVFKLPICRQKKSQWGGEDVWRTLRDGSWLLTGEQRQRLAPGTLPSSHAERPVTTEPCVSAASTSFHMHDHADTHLCPSEPEPPLFPGRPSPVCSPAARALCRQGLALLSSPRTPGPGPGKVLVSVPQKEQTHRALTRASASHLVLGDQSQEVRAGTPCWPLSSKGDSWDGGPRHSPEPPFPEVPKAEGTVRTGPWRIQ